MRRLLVLVCLLLSTRTVWPQASGDLVFVARRSGVGEVLDAATLETVARIHFDFHLDRLSASGADASKLNVAGYTSGSGCCKHYIFDAATYRLEQEGPSSPVYNGNFGDCFISSDGRWCFRLKSFQGPVLRIVDRTGSEPPRELIPPGVPVGDESGNSYAQGAWSADRFYLYVARPDHPGLLWIVSPDAKPLSTGIPVAPFNEDPNCSRHSPVVKNLVAAGGNLLLYETFGNRNKSSRRCAGLPGGAWIVDPATGRLVNQIAPEFHFSSLIANPSGTALYGVALALGGNDSLGEPEQVVRLNAHDGTVTNVRALGPGESLLIAVGRISVALTGDLTAR